MNLPPYPSYQESGARWLGIIPARWKLVKTKYLFAERVQKGFPDEPMLAATQTKGVVPKSHYESRTVVAQKDLHLLKLVKVGDFVISLRSFQGGIEYAHYRGIISPAYTVMIPNGKITAPYFRHLSKSNRFIGLLRLCVTGIREGQNIDYGLLREVILPVPPLPEQEQIARFLDWKTGQIGKLIRNKRRLIALLKEQKQNLIHHAVTRGLDPNTKLKPSGVEWLGDVPEHWEVRRNAAIFSERIESGTDNLPLLVVSLKTGVTIAEEVDERGRPKRTIQDRTKYKRALKDDIAYNMMRLWQGAVGVVPEDGLVSPAYVVAARRSDSYPQYFEMLFRTTDYMNAVNQVSRGIVSDRNRTYWENFKQLKSPIPPLDEQRAILAHISEQTATIDKAIARAEREIELIGEYRTRLIADVVTGQVDVRGVEVPQVAEADNTPEEDDEASFYEADVEADTPELEEAAG